ncbi:MAG: hypothetical protein M1820_010024 [Bogoriella megaspora]|nr:MAG: hypothetical protein M1820_010024 [Bogoriella megaspora]
MTTIKEGQVLETEADLAQLLNLDDDDALETCSTQLTNLTSPVCPSHPYADDCLCHGFMGDWNVEPVSSLQPEVVPQSTETGQFEDFATWIPRYSKPCIPCDYCKARQLECFIFMTQEGQTTCSPCNALFRECSFTREALGTAHTHVGVIDTLHVVSEDVARDAGALTGCRPLKSLTGPNVDNAKDEQERGRKGGIRFSNAAVKILRDWLDTHSSHPYPTESEKNELKRRTELSSSQISNWLANARRRGKIQPKRAVSPSLHTASQAIKIPQGIDRNTWENLNPLDRWKHSPPENEPADVSDIANAVTSNKYDPVFINSTPANFEQPISKQNSSGSSHSAFHAPSITSHRTTKSSGPTLSESAWSHGSKTSSFGSFGSFNSLNKKERRRRKRIVRPLSSPNADGFPKPRMFQCTFCTDTFVNKYDWTRHEKSLHLNLEKWICAPLGPIVTSSESGEKKCVYCEARDPTAEHLATHNHECCENKGLEVRTFYRKDHLRQHLRLMHNCELIPSMNSWKSSLTHINSRCGFCTQTFTIWQERVDHLAKHFRNGAMMKDWKGCRGLDAEVAMHVTKAMPPYLIGQEASSPVPFSATNGASIRNCLSYESEGAAQHFASFPDCPSPRNTDKLTCWEILTVRLGRFALDHMAQGFTPSDEMLQDHARNILYDNNDPWNQTAADNTEWLSLFKKAHGLGADIAGTEEQNLGKSLSVPLWDPQDIEKYGDLGLSVPFSLTGFPNASKPMSPPQNAMQTTPSSAMDLLGTGDMQGDFDFDQIFTSTDDLDPVLGMQISPEHDLMYGN